MPSRSLYAQFLVGFQPKSKTLILSGRETATLRVDLWPGAPEVKLERYVQYAKTASSVSKVFSFFERPKVTHLGNSFWHVGKNFSRVLAFKIVFKTKMSIFFRER